MKRIALLFLSFLFVPAVLTSCRFEKNIKVPVTYEQISPSQAKSIMDSGKKCIILDVRTEEEYNEGHIKGAILIPDYEISEKAESILTDKNELILVYCRSGRRSKLASAELVRLGYTNVKEFGGILDWIYGTVTG